MSAPKPPCREGRSWLTKRLGRSALAPLTGQDAAALSAFVHLLELYVRADGNGQQRALIAMRAALDAMQPSTRHIAKAAIPYIMDWSDEARLWSILYPSSAPRTEATP